MVSLVFASGRSRVAYFHGIGTGKTPCALYTLQMWGCKKILVVCPVSAFDPWDEAIPKFTDFTHQLITGGKESKRNKIDVGADISVINYEGLKSLYADFVLCPDGKSRKWVLNTSKFVDKFDGIVFDEVHNSSNYRSLQSAICVELSRRATHVIGLSGTPIDKSLLDLFNIYHAIDLGRTLGNNFYQYRNKNFYQAGFTWKTKDGKYEEILSKLSDSTISFTRDECVDLPELQEVDLWLDPSDEFIKIQEDVIDGKPLGIALLDPNKRDGKKISILRQIPSGFLYLKDGHKDGYVLLKSNPKLDALNDIINSTDSKMIIFYQYVAECEIIRSLLKDRGIKFVEINGDQKIENRRSEIHKFKDGKYQIMLAHQRCASEGFDGTAANVVIFFSPIASPKVREQCIGRVWRSGQTEKSLVINLMLKRSVDKTVAKSRDDRTSMVRSVKEFIRGHHS